MSATRRRCLISTGATRDNKNGPGGAGNTNRDLTHSSDPTREGLTVKVTSGPPAPPVDWTARCKLAAAVLNQREPSWHAAVVAKMALTGASIDDIRAADTARIMAGGAA